MNAPCEIILTGFTKNFVAGNSYWFFAFVKLMMHSDMTASLANYLITKLFKTFNYLFSRNGREFRHSLRYENLFLEEENF